MTHVLDLRNIVIPRNVTVRCICGKHDPNTIHEISHEELKAFLDEEPL